MASEPHGSLICFRQSYLCLYEGLQLLAYYKLVKAALAVEPSLIEEILTQPFLSETINFMKKDPSNNILHNFQREVLVNGIKESPKVCQILQDEIEIE
jgi:hypothetical protein